MSGRVKQQFIQDMQLAGLARSTQKVYLANVMRFVRSTRTRPQDASEQQVAEYLRGLINQGRCHGTIQPMRGALQFIFQNTLQRHWGLFKKRLPRCVAGVCPRRPARPRFAA